MSSSTVSELNQKIYEQIEVWRNLPIAGEHAYVYLDGIWLKRSWGDEVKNIAIVLGGPHLRRLRSPIDPQHVVMARFDNLPRYR